MTPTKIRDARLKLGLTPAQAAPLLGYGSASRISEIETAMYDGTPVKNPSKAVLRLLQAYLDGYRPADWPAPTPPKGPTA